MTTRETGGRRRVAETDAIVDLVMPRPHPLEPPPLLAHLRSTRPVARVRCPRGIDAWLVTRYGDVRRVLADPGHFSSVDAPFGHLTDSWELGSPPDPGALIRMDGDGHLRLRRRLAKEFTVRRMQAFRPRLQAVVDAQLDSLAGSDGPVDLYAAFALPVGALAICELLGVPTADRGAFYRLAARINDLTATPQQRRDADTAIHAYLRDRVSAELVQPGDNIIGRLVQGNDAHDDPLTPDELTTLAATLLVAGHETSANMISLMVVWLLQGPARDPRRGDGTIGDHVIDEALRDLAIVHYGVLRRASSDTTLAGRAIRAGDYVVVSIPAANHDPALPVAQQGPPRHVAFGHGPHKCLGQYLARAEIQIALSRLFERIPTLRLTDSSTTCAYHDDMTVYGVSPLLAVWESVLP